ncbi:hypothetical protein NVI2019_PEGOAJLN_03646 [Providencia alcalifaciens]|uniref:Glycosyl transferase family 2 n=2 Tax=Providencia alcalifaciens TaxID=126385 RepID=A0A346CL86_9GAMM|nr:glycosyltransferase family 2 protein [Providencia alcalifaciens]AXL96360.1 glycosyl transferase family 2 [Providencia alcalifaciens]EUD04713.1 glycosyltransferase, group 2 family protein [Providencia alcalifaciens RIMD 1656011]EUD10601.1 glycosyltransferase, group 2 family protein [Providencia alcalifaciens 205/92]MTC15446.1 glycosyltransferase [Providencia alcalifaciens]MTC62077.1 glycosyltransferase [Providencia alcalifaciens]
MNQKVSIIIPCFNCESSISQTLTSLLNQSYSNLEILLCDDGSTDKTYEIIQNLQKKDIRIKVMKNEENMGIIFTLNHLLDVSSGKYIARMDSDDICHPKRIEEQIIYIKKNKLDGAGSFYKTFGKKTKVIKLPIGIDSISYCLGFMNTFCHPSIMIKSEVYKKYQYATNAMHIEDYDLWSRMIKNGVKIDNINKVLLYYRLHPNQISKVKSKEQTKKNSLIKANNMILVLKEKKSFSSEDESIMKNALVNFWQGTATINQLKITYNVVLALKKNKLFKKNYIFIRKHLLLGILRNRISIRILINWAKILSFPDFILVLIIRRVKGKG